MPGLLREYAVVPAHNAELVPENFSYTQASLIEPIAVIMHMLELVQIHAGDSVAVLGAGPIGLLAAAVARHCGASQVLMADKLPHRIKMAQDLCATAAVSIGQFRELVGDKTRGRGVDLAIDAAGAAETINAALAVTRLGGTFVLIGIPIVQLGFAIVSLICVWAFARTVAGAIYLSQDQAYPRPRTWLI